MFIPNSRIERLTKIVKCRHRHKFCLHIINVFVSDCVVKITQLLKTKIANILLTNKKLLQGNILFKQLRDEYYTNKQKKSNFVCSSQRMLRNKFVNYRKNLINETLIQSLSTFDWPLCDFSVFKQINVNKGTIINWTICTKKVRGNTHLRDIRPAKIKCNAGFV